MKVSVVVPVYNEIATLKELVRRVVAVGMHTELILVDDGSTDGCREALRELDGKPLSSWLPGGAVVGDHTEVVVVLQPHNQGKGAALRTGFQRATGDIVVIQDADLEYDPRDIPRLIQPIARRRSPT